MRFEINKNRELLEAIRLSYEFEEPIRTVKTKDQKELTDVEVSEVQSNITPDPNIERLCGCDGSGIQICFEIHYTDSDSIEKIILRRGRAETEYGEVSYVELA